MNDVLHFRHVTKSPSFALSMRQGDPLICALRLREDQISPSHPRLRELTPKARGSQEMGFTQPRAQISGERCQNTLDLTRNTNTASTIFLLARRQHRPTEKLEEDTFHCKYRHEDLFTGIG